MKWKSCTEGMRDATLRNRLDVVFIHVFQGAMSNGRKTEAIQSSYKAIVKYCEEPR